MTPYKQFYYRTLKLVTQLLSLVTKRTKLFDFIIVHKI